MEITIEHHEKSFNVAIASAPGKEPFIVIKGCRIANGSKGEFVSWPATKNESTGKWWNHVYANEKFSDVVLSKVREAEKNRRPQKSHAPVEDDSDIPF